MKTRFIKIQCIIAAAMIMSVATACGHSESDSDPHADHDHEHAEGHVHGESESAASGEHGDDEIILEPAMAEKMGVETQKLLPQQFYEVIRVNGQIEQSPTDVALAVAPTSGIVTLAPVVADGRTVTAGTKLAGVTARDISGGDADHAASVAIASAKREVDRLRPLLDEGLVTAREYNEALSRYEAALTAYSPKAASGVVSAPLSGVITQVLVNQGQYVDAGQPLVQISKNTRLALKADLPEKYFSFLNTVTGANFRVQGSEDIIRMSDVGGHRISDPGITTASNGYLPVYFNFVNNGKVAPGSYVEVFLTGTPRSDVIVVPLSAITEQLGAKYVYVKIEDDAYERRQVKTGGNDGSRVEILSGLQSGDEVVVKGATAIRLSENSGKIPEGHSHNH